MHDHKPLLLVCGARSMCVNIWTCFCLLLLCLVCIYCMDVFVCMTNGPILYVSGPSYWVHFVCEWIFYLATCLQAFVRSGFTLLIFVICFLWKRYDKTKIRFCVSKISNRIACVIFCLPWKLVEIIKQSVWWFFINFYVNHSWTKDYWVVFN